jgi:hypothetical protein
MLLQLDTLKLEFLEQILEHLDLAMGYLVAKEVYYLIQIIIGI